MRSTSSSNCRNLSLFSTSSHASVAHTRSCNTQSTNHQITYISIITMGKIPFWTYGYAVSPVTCTRISQSLGLRDIAMNTMNRQLAGLINTTDHKLHLLLICRPAYPKMPLSVIKTACVCTFRFWTKFFSLRLCHQSIGQNRKYQRTVFPSFIL